MDERNNNDGNGNFNEDVPDPYYHHLNDTQPLSMDHDEYYSSQSSYDDTVDTAPIYAVKNPDDVRRQQSGWPDTKPAFPQDWVSQHEREERDQRRNLPWYRKSSGWAVLSFVLIGAGIALYLASNFGYMLFRDYGREAASHPTPKPSASVSRPIKTQTPKPAPTTSRPSRINPVPSEQPSESSDGGIIDRGIDWARDRLNSSPTPTPSVPSVTAPTPEETLPEESDPSPSSSQETGGNILDSLPSVNTDAIEQGWNEFREEGRNFIEGLGEELNNRINN